MWLHKFKGFHRLISHIVKLRGHLCDSWFNGYGLGRKGCPVSSPSSHHFFAAPIFFWFVPSRWTHNKPSPSEIVRDSFGAHSYVKFALWSRFLFWRMPRGLRAAFLGSFSRFWWGACEAGIAFPSPVVPSFGRKIDWEVPWKATSFHKIPIDKDIGMKPQLGFKPNPVRCFAVLFLSLVVAEEMLHCMLVAGSLPSTTLSKQVKQRKYVIRDQATNVWDIGYGSFVKQSVGKLRI